MTMEIRMPALSPTMTEGKLARWLKQPGDAIASGEIIAEIETDKATMEIEAAEAGILGEILIPDGSENVAVDTVIARLRVGGEEMVASKDLASAAEPPRAGPAVRKLAAEHGLTLDRLAGTGRDGRVTKEDVLRVATEKPGESRNVSPLAHRVARQLGVNLAGLTGSGAGGRVQLSDLAVRRSASPSVPTATAPIAQSPDARALADALGMRYETVPNTTQRKTIARRLQAAKQTVPHFYLSVEVAAERLFEFRAELHAQSGVKLSINDLVIGAVARALRKVPAANAIWTDESLLLLTSIDIAVAVATPQGLVTPIVREADRKGLAEIATEMRELAARARDGKLRPEEYQGGGFTISNLGMYGIDSMTPILNPPQAAILGVGRTRDVPVARNGTIAIGKQMNLTLAADHRPVDGAVGAELLTSIRALLEEPMTMLL